MRKICMLLLTLLLVVACAGCGNKSEDNGAAKKSITVTDSAGRKVTIKQPVKTYAISTFDVIDFVIPLKKEKAFEMLVGVGDSGGKKSYDKEYGPKFPKLKDQWKIISPHNSPFDVEAVLAAKPDVLIVNSAMQAHMHALDIENRLKEAGIPLVLIDVPKVPNKSAQDTYRLLGEIFGEQENAKKVNAFLDKQFKDIEDRLAKVKGPKPLVYYEKSGNAEVYGPSSFSGSTGWGAVVKYAGGENLADRTLKEGEKGKGMVRLAPEFVLTSDPDFVILSGGSEMGLAVDKDKAKVDFSILQRPGWQNLKAVKNHHVYEFQHELSRTPFVFYPAMSFAKIFYPEQFADIDPDQRLAEFFDKFMIIKSTDGLWKVEMP